MLGLRAVDVDRVGVGDRDHEHGSVAGLTVVVLVLAASVATIGATVGVSGDGLEVGEDSVLLRLARVVGSRRGNRVVLDQVSDVIMAASGIGALPERRS